MNPDASSSLIACHECDVLQREASLPIGRVARCVRCGTILHRRPRDGLSRSLAFTVSAAIAFLLAMVYPLMTLESRGSANSATLLDTVSALYGQGKPVVASLVLVTGILVPAVNIAANIYLLLPLKLGWIPYGFNGLFRLVHSIRPWGMTEVFMLGVLVSLVRLNSVAEAAPEIGFWAFGAVMLLMAASAACFEPRDLWDRIAEIQRMRSVAVADPDTP